MFEIFILLFFLRRSLKIEEKFYCIFVPLIHFQGLSLKKQFVSLLRFILYPFSLLYDLVTRIRNFFYDLGFFKSKTFSIPIIAV